MRSSRITAKPKWLPVLPDKQIHQTLVFLTTLEESCRQWSERRQREEIELRREKQQLIRQRQSAMESIALSRNQLQRHRDALQHREVGRALGLVEPTGVLPGNLQLLM